MSKETTHIRIDKELKQQLQAMARCDETVSDVIRRLVNGEPAVNGPVNEQVNNTLHEELQALARRVQVLEEKGARKEPDHRGVIPENELIQPELQPVVLPTNADSAVAKLKTEDVLTSGRRGLNTQCRLKMVDQDRITLTNDMKIQLADRVKRALDSGKHYQEISTLTRVSESTLKKIKNNLLDKSISRSWYSAVMSLD